MLTDRYATRIRGVLSCFDRILITGTLPDICHAQAFTRELNRRRIRIFEFSQFAQPLREAIRQTKRVGIATIVLRDAQHLAAVEVIKDAMVLTLMRYAEELVDTKAFDFPTAKDVRKPELDMARTLVENLADTWDPSQYTDEYRENLMKIIRAKMKGKQPKLVEHEEPRTAEVVDLMERLRQSLQGTGGRSTARTATNRADKKTGSRKQAARGKRKRAA